MAGLNHSVELLLLLIKNIMIIAHCHMSLLWQSYNSMLLGKTLKLTMEKIDFKGKTLQSVVNSLAK